VPTSLRDQLPDLFNIATACCDRWVEAGHGQRPAVHHDQGTLSCQDLQLLVNRLGNGLQSLGLRPGDRFLIRLPAVPEFYAAFLAGLKIGAVAIPTPQLLRERELRHIMTIGDVRVAITTEDLAGPIRSIRHEIPRLAHVVCLGNGDPGEVELASLIARSEDRLVAHKTTPGDPAFVLFSSGTTGVPKGIAHAHRAFNLAVGDPCGKIGMALTSDDVVLQPHDPAWSYSLGCGFLFPLCEGASLVASSDRIPPEEVMRWVDRYRVTILASVPTFYRAILSHPGIEDGADLSSLRHCTSAGEPLTNNTYHEWKRRFGVHILDHIGQGETSMFCANTLEGGITPGSVGRPLPGYRVAVIHESGKEVVGEIGHLVISDDNPTLFYDYLGMPEKWEATHRDGWYRTGDLALVDNDGNFWYVSRSDDLITSRGYLISPKEVEDTLVDHPSIFEAAVVGHPHEEMGQIVSAYVSLQPGYEATPELAEELITHTRSQIAPFKAPKQIEFLDELPKTATGKILRRNLRPRP
jgi:acetyl-CoA synthetase